MVNDEKILEKITQIEKYLSDIHKNGVPIRNLYTTKSTKYPSTAVNSSVKDILVLKDAFGTVEQLLIKSNSTSFSLDIMLDNEQYLNETYTWLNSNQNYLNNVSAFAVGSTYYVILKNMNFQKDCWIRVRTSASVTFSEIVTIYNVRSEQAIVS